MAYTNTAEISSVRGATVRFGTFTLNAASIAAAAKGSETVTVAGVVAGDQVFINARNAPAMIAVTGAAVTGTDQITVYINNVYDASTAVNADELTFDIIIVKFTA